MAKSDIKKLQEAIARGDLEAAKTLTDKIAAASKPKKPRKTTKVAPPPPAQPGRIIDLTGRPAAPQEDGITTIYSRGGGDSYDPFAGRTVVRNGKEYRFGRRVSLANVQFDPEFVSDDVKLPPRHMKVEKKLRNAPVMPKPGEPGADRDAAVLARIACVQCSRVYDVPVGELTEEFDDEGRATTIYRCDRCIRRGR